MDPVSPVESGPVYEPQEIVAGAQAAGLDYFVSTEQNTDTANAIWGRYAQPDVLTIGGEEVTTRGGHWGAIGLPPATWIDWRYRPQDDLLGAFVNRVHRAGGLAVVNHPFAPCKACNWSFPYEPMDAIEVWNGAWTADDEAAVTRWDELLRDGRRLVAVGASDAHRPPDPIGRPQTVVRARALAQRTVLDGIADGHVYIAAGKDVVLRFTASERGRRVEIGDTLRAGRPKAKLRVRGAAGASVTLKTDRGVAATLASADDDAVLKASVAGRWVRAEVRRPDGSMVALTNPIWLR